VFSLVLLLRTPPWMKRYMPFLVGIFVTTVLLYSLAMLRVIPVLDVLLAPVTLFTGKDLTFTGRADIWALVLDNVSLNPILGCGFGAYWVPPMIGTASHIFLERLRFYPWEAHNGYLDVLNELGSAGLVILIGYLLVHVRQSLQVFRVDRAQAALYLGLFLEQAIGNLSESHFFNVNDIGFVFMTLASATLARYLVDQRFRALVRWPQPAPQVPARPALSAPVSTARQAGPRPP
jgi:O-antigen ligase